MLLLHYVHGSGVPWITLTASGALTRDTASPTIFRIAPSNYQMGLAPAKWLHDKLCWKKIVWVGANYSAPREIFEAFKTEGRHVFPLPSLADTPSVCANLSFRQGHPRLRSQHRPMLIMEASRAVRTTLTVPCAWPYLHYDEVRAGERESCAQGRELDRPVGDVAV
jgi:hypothetical protein